jgi:hypothetical protein
MQRKNRRSAGAPQQPAIGTSPVRLDVPAELRERLRLDVPAELRERLRCQAIAAERQAQELQRCRDVIDAALAAERPLRSKPARRKVSRAQELIKRVAREEFPGGYDNISPARIIDRVSRKIKQMGVKIPLRDTFLRALGRRRG